MELGNPMSRKKRETWGTRPYSFLALSGTTEVVPFPSLAVARRGIPCLANNARHGAPDLWWRRRRATRLLRERVGAAGQAPGPHQKRGGGQVDAGFGGAVGLDVVAVDGYI